jgi:hypothetical protein
VNGERERSRDGEINSSTTIRQRCRALSLSPLAGREGWGERLLPGFIQF